MPTVHQDCVAIGCQARLKDQMIEDLRRQVTELKLELNSRYGKARAMELPEGIQPENLSLWCEITGHSFSAKDEGMVTMQHKGKSRLSCGDCAMGLFSLPTDTPGKVDKSLGM